MFWDEKKKKKKKKKEIYALSLEHEQLWVDVKNMHYIPFSMVQLQNGLLGTNTKKERIKDWKEFILKIDLIFAARYHMLKGTLVEDFSPFDPNLEVPNELPDSKLALLEDRFFSNFKFMLERANFDPLTKEDAELASAHDFLNTVPIEPQWLKMDPVFARYMEQHPDFEKSCHSGARRIWIYHRGIGIAKYEGMLVMQKIDELLFRMFGRCCGKKRKPVDATKKEKEEAEPQKQKQKEGQGVERITIKSIVAKNGVVGLFKPTLIQEPTFKEVVMCYRMDANKGSVHESANPKAIYVKVFRDVPHADLEVLYPAKSSTLRPLDVVKFAGAGIFGLVSILMQRQAGDLVGYSALTGFLTLAVSVLFDYQYHQSVYEQTTLRDLYSKSKDNDKGAINFLVEEVGLQEVKETFLAYYFLCESPRPLTQSELDEKIEAFLEELQTVFGFRECKIDFEVDDALDKLENMHLVLREEEEDETEEAKYRAVPLVDGLDELNSQWSGLMISTDK